VVMNAICFELFYLYLVHSCCVYCELNYMLHYGSLFTLHCGIRSLSYVTTDRHLWMQPAHAQCRMCVRE